MKSQNRYFIFVLTLVLFSSPLFAQEAATVSDAVNVYAYNPDKPGTLSPVYVGDAIPANAILYLPGANSSITLTKDGTPVTLNQPGFYDTSGSPAAVSGDLRASIQALAQKLQKSEAENLIRDAEADVAEFAIDDPQTIPSPSN